MAVVVLLRCSVVSVSVPDERKKSAQDDWQNSLACGCPSIYAMKRDLPRRGIGLDAAC